MNVFCRNMADESSPSQHDIIRCPFLRNINEPTKFSFSSSMAFPLPARGTKGPIFEDGPNFDMAFRLFHGQNGVVPLSEGSVHFPQRVKPEPAPQRFNPLAAKAATISLSGLGGSFGFDAFNEMFKNQQKKHKSSKKNSQGGDSGHEAMGEEWLQRGNCPIAKSYLAIANVLPIVAKALKPPSGIKYKCPPAIVAARAAIARIAFAKNLRPQPLPEKILVIGLMGMAANVSLGVWRDHTVKFSPACFVAVHAAIPFLGNINEPTNFSFSSSMASPLPARGTKGPIFEDGPNFDIAFRLFLGQNGVVPLSKSLVHFPQPEPAPQQFNPLAAKAATISLSGLGGPFGLDAFNEMFKNQQKKHTSSKKNSQGGDSGHEAMGEEWLQSGNCPIAKSYRAVSYVLPIVAKALKPPSGINYKCGIKLVGAVQFDLSIS